MQKNAQNMGMVCLPSLLFSGNENMFNEDNNAI